jgi:recombination protein RecR
LLQLITTKNISDVIIAFDWTNSGELSALNIRNSLLSRFPKLTIYRLAVGLPVNSAINYADETTLKYAIKNKFKY